MQTAEATANETKPLPKAAPRRNKLVVSFGDFEAELKQREQQLASMLPSNVNKARFLNSAIAAVKQTPDLLTCTPRSLFSAITKSAQDGLLPDGREGVITIYREKQKDDSWANVAQWNPMAWGLRKRARELDGIIVSTSVVCENDFFEYEEGDDPRLIHRPAKLGQPRGAMIGAYAIYRKDNDILHREIMDATQIGAVREQSKAKNGLLWTKFESEGWRKTVLRRGFKSVPCSERLQTILQRDDEQFDFNTDGTHGAIAGPSRPKPTVIQGGAGEKKPLPPVVGEQTAAQEPAEAVAEETPADILAKAETWFDRAPDLDELEAAWSQFEHYQETLGEDDAATLRGLYETAKAKFETGESA